MHRTVRVTQVRPSNLLVSNPNTLTFFAERLVHGPLTALMLLEVLQFYKPGLQLHAFEYRARNPVIVNRNCTIHGALTSENKADMWCADDDGVVGMTGSVTFSQ